MKPINILLTGASGRMGKEIIQLASSESVNIVATVDRVGAATQRLPKPHVGMMDVVVDFSAPELLREVLQWCLNARTPVVSGTTGLMDSDFALLKKVSETVPVLWSANMSLGITLITKMFQLFRSAADEFDFQIEETHHSRKLDAPSGTAQLLQRALQSEINKSLPSPVSIRGGGVFGVHKIWAMGEEEIITIEHTALNRRVFARGALRAAKWLSARPPGLYSISDVLGFSGADR